MEKRKPTYDLSSVKAAFCQPERLAVTLKARQDATRLGFDDQDIVDAIQSMERRHFYKSMTSFADHAAWQDVYHVPFNGVLLYVKFTADRVTVFRLLSFKEK